MKFKALLLLAFSMNVYAGGVTELRFKSSLNGLSLNQELNKPDTNTKPVIGDVSIQSVNGHWGNDGVLNGSLSDGVTNLYGGDNCLNLYASKNTMTITVQTELFLGLYGNDPYPQYNGELNLLLKTDKGVELISTITLNTQPVWFSSALKPENEYVLSGVGDVVFCEMYVK